MNVLDRTCPDCFGAACAPDCRCPGCATPPTPDGVAAWRDLAPIADAANNTHTPWALGVPSSQARAEYSIELFYGDIDVTRSADGQYVASVWQPVSHRDWDHSTDAGGNGEWIDLAISEDPTVIVQAANDWLEEER